MFSWLWHLYNQALTSEAILFFGPYDLPYAWANLAETFRVIVEGMMGIVLRFDIFPYISATTIVPNNSAPPPFSLHPGSGVIMCGRKYKRK